MKGDEMLVGILLLPLWVAKAAIWWWKKSPSKDPKYQQYRVGSDGWSTDGIAILPNAEIDRVLGINT